MTGCLALALLTLCRGACCRHCLALPVRLLLRTQLCLPACCCFPPCWEAPLARRDEAGRPQQVIVDSMGRDNKVKFLRVGG